MSAAAVTTPAPSPLRRRALGVAAAVVDPWPSGRSARWPESTTPSRARVSPPPSSGPARSS